METLSLQLVGDEEQARRLLRSRLEELFFTKARVEIVLELEKKPTGAFVASLFELFFDYKMALLKAIDYPRERLVNIIHGPLRSGEVQTIAQSSIFVGDLHEGSSLHVFKPLTITGLVEGTIYLDSDEAFVFASRFQHAQIRCPHGVIHTIDGQNLTVNNQERGEVSWRELSL